MVGRHRKLSDIMINEGANPFAKMEQMLREDCLKKIKMEKMDNNENRSDGPHESTSVIDSITMGKGMLFGVAGLLATVGIGAGVLGHYVSTRDDFAQLTKQRDAAIAANPVVNSKYTLENFIIDPSVTKPEDLVKFDKIDFINNNGTAYVAMGLAYNKGGEPKIFPFEMGGNEGIIYNYMNAVANDSKYITCKNAEQVFKFATYEVNPEKATQFPALQKILNEKYDCNIRIED